VTLFKTLDENRNEFTTRRERLLRWVVGSALAMLLLGGIYLITLTV